MIVPSNFTGMMALVSCALPFAFHICPLLLELYELVYDKEVSLSTKIHKQLLKLKQNKHFTKLIADGLELIIKK